MGATNFDTIVRGKDLSMTDAYRQAVEQATYDYGHDPYNGTISTTSGVALAPDLPGPGPFTLEQANAHLWHPEGQEAWWDKDHQPQKWEAAWAIPLAAEGDTEPGWLFYGWAAC